MTDVDYKYYSDDDLERAEEVVNRLYTSEATWPASSRLTRNSVVVPHTYSSIEYLESIREWYSDETGPFYS